VRSVGGVAEQIEVMDLGTMPYEEAMKVQSRVLEKKIKGETRDTLIMVEHLPVLTLGRLSKKNSIIDERYFRERGIPVVNAGRGGKITFHSTGQLVLYPIVDLGARKKDISFYIDFLEKCVVRALVRFRVPAERCNGRRGVWVSGRKIAFTGIGVKRWVTYHGVSVNINNDPEAFSKMHPCGESDIKVTTAKEVLGKELDMSIVRKVFEEEFISALGSEYGAKTQPAVFIK